MMMNKISQYEYFLPPHILPHTFATNEHHLHSLILHVLIHLQQDKGQDDGFQFHVVCRYPNQATLSALDMDDVFLHPSHRNNLTNNPTLSLTSQKLPSFVDYPSHFVVDSFNALTAFKINLGVLLHHSRSIMAAGILWYIF